MFPSLTVGPLVVPVPALISLLGIWIGITWAERRSERLHLNSSRISGLIFAVIIGGLVGGRLAIVARYPQAFLSNPLNIISPNPGLFDPLAGLILVVLVGAVYGQHSQLPLWPTLDALVPLVAVLGFASGLNHLSSGLAYGSPTNLPWAIYLWGADRHPSQVYEILAAAVPLILILPAGNPIVDRGLLLEKGSQFLAFCAYAAASRLFLEAFRGDSELVLGRYREAQIFAWIILAICFFLLARQNRDSPMASTSDRVEAQ